MLEEPKLFCRKAGHLLAEGQSLRLAAICFDPQLMGVIQAYKTHITGGIDDLVIVLKVYGEGLLGGQLYKVLDLLKGAKANTEFLQKIPPLLLYKRG